MSVLKLQLSLCLATLIHVTSSLSVYDGIRQGMDVTGFCGRNEPLFRELVMSNSRLQSSVSQLQRQLAKIKADIARSPCTTGVEHKGTKVNLIKHGMQASVRENVCNISKTFKKFFFDLKNVKTF